MDIKCSTCGKPWDPHHLRHYAIFDTRLSVNDAEAWCALSQAEKLSRRYQEEFLAVGWEFGQTVINVIRCPCCPKDAKPPTERNHIKTPLEELVDQADNNFAEAKFDKPC